MDKRSYKIYKIVNSINDKVYIGQTVHSLKNRFEQHCKCSTSKLGKDVLIFGKNNFKIQLLNDSATSNKELSLLEDSYIKTYDSINNGYNSRPGSSSSANLSKPLKSSSTITIDEEIIEKLKLLADKEDRSLSGQINKILKVFFEKKED